MAIAGCTNDNIVRCNHYALGKKNIDVFRKILLLTNKIYSSSIDACYPTDDYAAIQWQIYNPPPENY